MMLELIQHPMETETTLPDHILNRKGPRSLKDLDPEVITYLNAGSTATKNLIEWLATDQLVLLKNVLQTLDKLDWYSSFEQPVLAQKKRTANSDVKVIGENLGLLTSDPKLYEQLRAHSSDIVRCWACWGESILHDGVKALLKAMRPYAADSHFGVREVVIFASKERMIADLDTAIELLTAWTGDADENVRRFAVEGLRPIGVWTKKIPQFQDQPALGLPLLEPLRSDGSKYVRDSVGNWLNDASKSDPAWVQTLCDSWTKQSDSKETAYIVKKALRTILKKK